MSRLCINLSLILALAVSSPLLAAGAETTSDLPFVGITATPPEPVQERLDDLFYRWQTFELDLERLEARAIREGSIELHLGAEVFTLEIEPNDLRASDFREEWMTTDGTLRDVVSPVGTFEGHLAGQPDTEVRLLILPDLLQGYIRTPDRWVFLDPLLEYNRHAPGHRIVVYDQDDVKPGKFGLCGAGRLGSRVEAVDLVGVGQPTHGLDAASTGNVWEAQVATEADFEYYSRFGSNTNSQIQGILNQVDGIYDDDLGLKLKITFQSVWTSSSDPYTTSNGEDLLNQFRNHWNSNRSDVTRDLAHLFTDKNIFDNNGNTSLAGIAWVGVVCSDPSWAYGVSEDVGSLMVKLVAHEIGHNFDARHDTSGCNGSGPIMCTPLQFNGPESFSSQSVNDVDNHVSANSGCLTFIKRTPNACFSTTDNGFYYTFDASCSSDPNGSVVSYHWDFGDGSTGTGKIINHSFSTGTWPITLTVTDNDGETGTRLGLVNNCLVYEGTDSICMIF